MNKRFGKYIGTWIVMMGSISSTLSGCQPHEGSEKQLLEDIDSFATYYYNWHFEKALKYCTTESEQWLRYAASNVHPADIDLLHAKQEDATVSIKDVDYHDDEVSASVNLQVDNFLQMDTIGKAAHPVGTGSFVIQMRMHGGKWKVDLDKEGLPKLRKANLQQNGSESHD